MRVLLYGVYPIDYVVLLKNNINHPFFFKTPVVSVLFSDFITIPSPPVLNVTSTERHVYMCNHSKTNYIIWRVNGSIPNVEIFPLEMPVRTIPLPNGGRVYTLEIGGRPEHNETTIQCSAILGGGSTVKTTPSMSFFMQG